MDSRIAVLEKRLKWQTRILIGLIVMFLFSASPALTMLSNSFPENLTSFFKPESGKLSKTALDSDDVLQVGRLEIVNDQGNVVALMGVDFVGDGFLAVRNREGKAETSAEISVDEKGDAAMKFRSKGRLFVAAGSDDNGNGAFGLLNTTTNEPTVLMGADPNGNGLIGISRGKFTAFVDENGDGVAVTAGDDGNVLWSSDTVVSTSGLLGDLDGDGDVDFADFLVFAQNFGRTSG